MKMNGWFVGFAPRRNPEIVVAALVQDTASMGQAAGPVVRDVVKALLRQEKRPTHSKPRRT